MENFVKYLIILILSFNFMPLFGQSEMEKHFASIERKSNWLIYVVADYNSVLHEMIQNHSNALVRGSVQYDISSRYKTKLGDVRYVNIHDYNMEDHEEYVKEYRAILYPNRLYFFEFTNIAYEIGQIHVMKDSIVVVYYSSEHKNFLYKVKYRFLKKDKLSIVSSEIINK